MRHNSQSSEKQKTEKEKYVIQEKKRKNSCKNKQRKKEKLQGRETGKERPTKGKPRKRNIPRKIMNLLERERLNNKSMQLKRK